MAERVAPVGSLLPLIDLPSLVCVYAIELVYFFSVFPSHIGLGRWTWIYTVDDNFTHLGLRLAVFGIPKMGHNASLF